MVNAFDVAMADCDELKALFQSTKRSTNSEEILEKLEQAKTKIEGINTIIKISRMNIGKKL
jgi:hypothetical protein